MKQQFQDTFSVKTFTILIHLLSYAFNFTLLYLVLRKRALKTRIYITNMVAAEILINLSQHFYIEIFWFIASSDIQFRLLIILFRYLSLLCTQLRYIVSFLMSVNRLIVTLCPILNKLFTQEMLKYYCFIIWSCLAIINVIYIMCSCEYTNYVLICDNYESEPFYIVNSFHILAVTCIINILAVVYTKIRRLPAFKSVVARVSRNSETKRKKHENRFVFHALIVFAVMSEPYGFEFITANYPEAFDSLPYLIKTHIYALNVYLNNLLNLLLYFILHPFVRKHVISIFQREKPSILYVTRVIGDVKTI
ncbi:unnamed protein product [Caenorhabditis bovis]|uniref:G-protein coupled receptors family 1 profile domain-containing protein n=1 Tax=Caenorhabditis bovis TaxID=2654633 RepID=A0A8S1E5T2_9PELO|nr:unnamed protein product [Caenorhabditis bovis]